MLLKSCKPSWAQTSTDGFGCTRAFVVGISAEHMNVTVVNELFAMDPVIYPASDKDGIITLQEVAFMDDQLTTYNISKEINVNPPLLTQENIYLSALEYNKLMQNLVELSNDFLGDGSYTRSGELGEKIVDFFVS